MAEPSTERRHPETTSIDVVSPREALQMVHADSQAVLPAVERVLPELADIVDETVARLERGGRLHYFGAGTSGRVAYMDAAELPPTFGVGPDLVTAHVAGGPQALTAAVEGAEDDAAAGARDAEAVGASDVAIGVTASGRTPYVRGALVEARAHGAFTVLVSGNVDAAIGSIAERHLPLVTGPEVIAGSTRLKAGTAQKLVLNAFSTVVMVRLGRTYSNLMVGMTPVNEKLRRRMLGLLVEASGEEEARCAEALAESDGDGVLALTMLLSGADVGAARLALVKARNVGAAARLISADGRALPAP